MSHKQTNNFFIIAIGLILSIAIFVSSCESLSRNSSVKSHNETESLVDETFEMEIKHIACGEYVLLKNDYVVERGTYEECNDTLNDYVEIYEWINEMSNNL
jgi:hypothetical protein